MGGNVCGSVPLAQRSANKPLATGVEILESSASPCKAVAPRDRKVSPFIVERSLHPLVVRMIFLHTADALPTNEGKSKL